MQRTFFCGTIFGILLSCFSVALSASEGDELRARAKALRKEASVLAERGDNDRAKRIQRESVELLEAAERVEVKAKLHGERGERPEIDKQVRRLMEQLRELYAVERKVREAEAPERELAGVRQQIAATQRELQQFFRARQAERPEHRPEFRAHVEKLEAATRRMHHLRVAAVNLTAAEMHDLAHQVMEKAEAMEREVREAKQRLAMETDETFGRRTEQEPEILHDLRAEVERLRAEVRELRHRLEER